MRTARNQQRPADTAAGAALQLRRARRRERRQSGRLGPCHGGRRRVPHHQGAAAGRAQQPLPCAVRGDALRAHPRPCAQGQSAHRTGARQYAPVQPRLLRARVGVCAQRQTRRYGRSAGRPRAPVHAGRRYRLRACVLPRVGAHRRGVCADRERRCRMVRCSRAGGRDARFARAVQFPDVRRHAPHRLRT